MPLMGSTERRIACLKIAASMSKRMTKEDPIPQAEDIMLYAAKLEQFAWRGEFRSKEDALEYQNELMKQIAERKARVAEKFDDADLTN